MVIMSQTNTSVRSLRDKFQHQQPQSSNRSRLEQKQEIFVPCLHCGQQQTITLIVAKDFTTNTKNVESVPLDRPRTLLRAVSTISEDEDSLPSPLERMNYALDIRHSTRDRPSPSALEENIQDLVDNCVRSSVHQVSTLQQTENHPPDIVEVEYDPILGNVKSTRKRSSTINTHLENFAVRLKPISNRAEPMQNKNERDQTPIWARRRTSHSTVKPSDLVREHDKREKLESNALRRLSRTDLIDENARSMNKSSYQNPSVMKETILRWCQEVTQYYKGVNIRNFSSSWSDGLAFCAIIHRYFPEEFNFETLNANEARQNFDLAFNVALIRAGIEPLIDTNDMLLMGNKPDPKVVFTYVQRLYRHLSRFQPPAILREHW